MENNLLPEVNRNLYEVKQILERNQLKIDRICLEMDRKLDTLIKNTHDIPTLVVILPLVETGYNMMIEKRCLLVFMCSHTRQLVPCGDSKEKNGFIISAKREWVKQVAPVAHLCLNILVDRVGDAIPAAVGSFYPDSAGFQSALKSALSLLGSHLSDNISSACASQPNQEFILNNTVFEEGSRAAYNAMKIFLCGKDIEACTGLVQKTAGGHTAWIKNDPEVIQSFHDRNGRRLE